MKYAVLFLLMAAGWAWLAISHGGWAWLLLWPAVSFALVAAAYGGAGVWMLGKRADGAMNPMSIALLLPFLLMTWTVWHLQRLLSRKPSHGEPAAGLWIGRRPLAGDLPDAACSIVDLTAEFPLARRLKAGCAYRCLPMLDASVPNLPALQSLIAEVAATPGPLYIHCAQGHGRSAMVTAAVLIARGHAHDVEDAVAQLQKVRPGVRLKPRQRKLLDDWFAACVG